MKISEFIPQIKTKIKTSFMTKRLKYSKKFEFTHESINEIVKMNSMSSLQLLNKLLARTKSGFALEDLVFEATYTELGYKHRQAFQRDRDRLKKHGFILNEGNCYYINHYMVRYVNTDQYYNFLRMFKLPIKGAVVPVMNDPTNIGKKVPPPPPPVPKDPSLIDEPDEI